MPAVKRKTRSRASKNKKVYWRKGVDLDDVEEFLNTKRFDETTGGPISERKDEDLFTIDKAGQEDKVKKLTRRQEAAWKKRQQLSDVWDDIAVEFKPTKRALKKKARCLKKKVLGFRESQSNGVASSISASNAPDIRQEPIDLWAGSENEITSSGQEYFEKATKKRMPHRPDTLKHISTLLPNVDTPQPGVSYNPTLKSYQTYVKEIAEDELRLERKEEKTKKNLELLPGENYVTQEEKLAEESAGLFDGDDVKVEEESAAERGADCDPSKPNLRERKTRKDVRQKALNKRNELEKKRLQELKTKEHLVYATRKLNKEVSTMLTEREEKAKVRKKKKALKKLMNPQKLGRGKFEDVGKAFLVSDELPGSLRELKPQGNILAERLKSLQKRNVLPVPGERIKSSLKKRLKVKEVERRSHREDKVTMGSHLKY